MSERQYGVYTAVVTESDPERPARLRVAVSSGPEVWARLAAARVPRAGDEVLVAFEAGDPRRPFVIGFLWNSGDSPPDSAYS